MRRAVLQAQLCGERVYTARVSPFGLGLFAALGVLLVIAVVVLLISALQTRIRALHERLSDPNLYARERAAFEQSSAELAAAEKDLATAEERWLELEILREDVAGQ